MTNEEQQMMDKLRREVERCFDLAKRLDAFNPELGGAFSGNSSERIERQLRACEAPGFTDG